MKKHLAIFTKDAVLQIFEGNKTVETRFSQKRIPPFGQVSVGDIVYIKPSGEDIAGQFLVSKVISFENLDEKDIELLRSNYGAEISLGDSTKDETYFSQKKESNFGTVMFISRVEQFIVSPIKISKRDQRGWVVLD